MAVFGALPAFFQVGFVDLPLRLAGLPFHGGLLEVVEVSPPRLLYWHALRFVIRKELEVEAH
jgi:hypothetical protein